VVYRSIPYTQAIDLIENDPQHAAVQEEGYDRAVILAQQLKDLITRSILLPVSATQSNLSLPEPEATKYLRWNAGGTALENIALTTTALAVSAFVETLLDDADAAAFIATLGLDADLATLSLPASTTISAYGKTLLDDADAAAFIATLGISAFAKTLLDDASAAEEQATLGISLPTNHFSGLALSHAVDTEHDITIAVGKARDATDAVDLILASALTKQADATWAVGTAAGGMAAGESLPTSGTIHVWLIKRSDTGVVDVMFNDHATSALAPTLPTGYDYKRRIGSYRTDGSANIINGDWWGTGLSRTFMYDTPILDVSTANPGTNAVTAALSVPSGIKVLARMNIMGGTNLSAYVSSLDNADLAPSATVAPLASGGGGPSGGVPSQAVAVTNTSAQIRYRALNDVAIYIATLGWEDSL
jgi:hypothetical protein